MTGSAHPELYSWAERLEGVIERERVALVGRVVVVAETGSTQDLAKRWGPGPVVVVAGRQTAGRGRLGRAWTQQRDAGVAMTVAFDAGGRGVGEVSLAAGVAAAEGVEAFVPRGGAGIGLKWPNDVVERWNGRKLAGVLVEGEAGRLLVGIGVNVHQRAGEWPEELRGRAASIAMLGGSAERIDVAGRVLVLLDRLLRAPAAEVRRRWMARDVLCGTAATFIHGGRTVRGVVESIEPAAEIVVRDAQGRVHRLPAMTTSLAGRGGAG